MNNTKTTEQIFLSHDKEGCPFCGAELSEIHHTNFLADGKESSIYDYGCQLQLCLYTEFVNEEEVTRLECRQCCSNRNTAVETILKLKYQTNQN